jgi:PAS domain S-box-containing protein
MASRRSYADLETHVAQLKKALAASAERMKSLEAKEEHFQRTLENLSDEFLFFRHDVSGKFTYVSPSYTNILGYQPEEYMRLTPEDYWTSNPINKAARRHTQLSIQGIRQPPYEIEIYHKSGARRRFITIETPVFNAKGEVVAVEGTSQHITEKRKAEEQLEKYRRNLEVLVEERTAELETSRKQLLDIINFLPDPTYVIDTHERIIAWNRAMAEMTAIPAAKILRQPYKAVLAELFPDEKPLLIEQVLNRRVPGGAQPAAGDGKPVVDDTAAPWGRHLAQSEDVLFTERYHPGFNGGQGGYFWATAAPILDTEGQIIGAIESLREVTRIKQAEEKLRSENLLLRSTIADRFKFKDIVGNCPAMQAVYDLILKAATSDESVLIQGESGTGKELVARAIHEASPRKDHPIVVVNCGAIPENLIESEFFGARKGAFTGAHQDKQGYLEAAENGTLFLDEIGEISPSLQIKLLRAIDGGGYSPVGSRRVFQPHVRFIAATNRDLMKMVGEGRIRSDFFYRIHVIPIHLPPLRERGHDLFLLIDHFLKRFSDGDRLRTLGREEIEMLRNHDWPGNVRELQNVLRRYVTFENLVLGNPAGTRPGGGRQRMQSESALEPQPLKAALDAFERKFIVNVLNQNRWYKTRAAKVMGISRKTLFRKMQRHGLLETQNGS